MKKTEQHSDDFDRRERSDIAMIAFVFAIAGPFLFFTTMPIALVLGITALIRIKLRPTQIRGAGLAIAAIVLSVGLTSAAFALWSLDAEPIENDWTIADLKSAPAECDGSYDLLQTITDRNPGEKGVAALGLSEQDRKAISEVYGGVQGDDCRLPVEYLEENASAIEEIIGSAQNVRDVVRRLNEYEEIADLADPCDVTSGVDAFGLMHLLQLYSVWEMYQIYTGDPDGAASTLIEFDTMIGKLQPNVRKVVTKLVCTDCVSMNHIIAAQIANDPTTSRQTLVRLRDNFEPIDESALTEGNPYIWEYLVFKHSAGEMLPSIGVAHRMIFKPRSLQRLLRNHLTEPMRIAQGLAPEDEGLSVWPEVYPVKPTVELDHYGKVPVTYRLYNPGGSRVALMFPQFRARRFREGTQESLVRSDMLWIVVNKRLGRDVSLKARFYGDEYIVDTQAGRIMSPGPDLEVGTEDDIYLPINAELLGL